MRRGFGMTWLPSLRAVGRICVSRAEIMIPKARYAAADRPWHTPKASSDVLGRVSLCSQAARFGGCANAGNKIAKTQCGDQKEQSRRFVMKVSGSGAMAL